MHLHFERIQRPSSYSDSNLSSLSWMGKVPDGLLQSEEDGWKLNRTNYYQDGWLSCGNVRGIVGVTFTTSRSRKNIESELPQRTNYNLRGHRSEVTLVKWNEPYQKLASCDSTGIIFVWIKYEGRWSIELINDRNTQVTDFSWSHDGRMALICYMDGFVLVGSVSGQRYWSSMLNLDSCTISCGIWSPDDQNVIFGTSSGHILVIDVHGTMVAQVSIQEGIGITHMSWSCEKFKMDDSDEEQRNNRNEMPNEEKTYTLAVSFSDGTVYIMRNYDDIFPIIIRTGLLSTKIEWSNNGEVLAIAGHQIRGSVVEVNGERVFTYENVIQFYTTSGVLRLKTELECHRYPITAITWGHSDKRLFIAAGPILYIAWITKRIPSLQLMSKLLVYNRLANEKLTEQLPLPPRLQHSVANLFSPTIQCYLPDLTHLRDFVSSPPNSNVRLHCTMIRHEDDILNSSTTYILYLEYLGGLVPILKGKRASKLKPEFVIFDPQFNNCETNNSKNYYNSQQNGSNNSSPYVTSSDSENDESLGGRSPATRRRRRFRRHFRPRSNESSNTSLSSNSSANNSKYLDEMPEQEKLVLVTSNIWGTKFKVLGLSTWLPSQLGTINYRTSLLHLQPRQMTLSIKELGEKRLDSSLSSINKFENNNNFMSSDSEDEMALSYMMDSDVSAPIAPMTPKKSIRCTNQSILSQTNTVSPEKRPTFQFQSTGQSSSDYSNCVEELLTLQINGDSHYVSMEMSGPTATNPAISALQGQNMSISTQTSFQSITELLNSLTLEKNTQTLFSPLIENKSLEEQTEETFSRLAKRFATDLPLNYNNSINSKCIESLHSPALIAYNNDLHYTHLTNSGSHSSGSPNVSPPKGLRYKIAKKESPRKASVSCIESDLTASSRSCDTTSTRFTSSPKSQRRYPVPSSFISSVPSASTWGSVSVFHCNNPLSDSLSLDSKSMIANDFKYIDDFDNEESVDSQQFSRTSAVFQKNRTICHMQPTIGAEFTNVRTGGTDSAIGHTFATNHTFQRRLTLKASKQSHSFESPNHSSEKSGNHRSFEEREEDEDEDRDNWMNDSNTVNTSDLRQKRNNHYISGDNSKCIHISDSKTTQSSITSNANSSPSLAYEHSSIKLQQKYKNSLNCVNNDREVVSNQTDCVNSGAIRLHNRLKSSETSKASAIGVDINDNHTSTSVQMAQNIQRLHNHRASLSQAMASTSTNSIETTSALQNRSLPASPLQARPQRRRASQGKSFLYSPMMLRKVMKQKFNYLDCSSESENTSDEEELDSSSEFRNLETFQKRHFRKKFNVKRRNSRVKPETQDTSPKKQTVSYREFVLHNKAPLWNEVSQVYQLDFGGRVTQESAKNFQIEYQGKQVMQFGRIDGNAYTLDFQYPFSALQALAVALANVTQRLK